MNLYVSNLDFTVTEKDLKDLFVQQGEVSSVKVITDYNTGRSRGFAFVEMPNDNEGKKAIEKINGKTLNNRTIAVQEARPKEEKQKRNNYPDQNSYSGRDGFRRR
ncbi:MAG: RNA-binding protein [Bacteroidota bacterium]|nr:RNA-binding protein [Flavisolibacter sp.]MDQ3847034.1 RNA-binding protein [Bacteroidota bacterium]MBD0283923.1 RNA-binding protein [Flavisolibacter sp.]MBD0296589.1 RNA-binding protein [Flavisolibacter sp.]MBD0350085.1 RNA-binding protein [Flavisolibacter sp.]